MRPSRLLYLRLRQKNGASKEKTGGDTGGSQRRGNNRTQKRKKQIKTMKIQVTGKANSVHDFAEQIGKKLAAAELMGAEGDVEGSIKLMEEVRDWR